MIYTPPVVPASGTTFAQFQHGGLTAMIERLIGVMIAGGPVTTSQLSMLRAAKQGNLQPVYKNLATLVEEWNAGRGVPSAVTAAKLSDLQMVFMALSQLCGEAGVLMDANPGTLGMKPSPLNAAQAWRTWP
jgi:hypothetical protein